MIEFMYAIVHYEDNTSKRSVECLTQSDYGRELEAGCRWVEDEPRQFRNLWGEIVRPVTFHVHNPRLMPSPLWDLTRPSR